MTIHIRNRYPVGTLPADSTYPSGSAVNSTTPESEDGFPVDAHWVNDYHGNNQALLRSGGILPNNISDNAEQSQVMSALVGQIAGNATTLVDTGTPAQYNLGPATNQHPSTPVITGQVFSFIAANTNVTGASVSIFGSFALGIFKPNGEVLAPGDIVTGGRYRLLAQSASAILLNDETDNHANVSTIDFITDENITLTEEQNKSSVLIVNDPNGILTNIRQVILNGSPREFTITNNTIWSLFVLTPSGAPFLLAGNSKERLRIDAITKDVVRDDLFARQSQFSGSLNTSGHQRLPSGLIYQWGRQTVLVPDNVGIQGFSVLPDVVFSISYPNETFSVNVNTFQPNSTGLEHVELKVDIEGFTGTWGFTPNMIRVAGSGFGESVTLMYSSVGW